MRFVRPILACIGCLVLVSCGGSERAARPGSETAAAHAVPHGEHRDDDHHHDDDHHSGRDSTEAQQHASRDSHHHSRAAASEPAASEPAASEPVAAGPAVAATADPAGALGIFQRRILPIMQSPNPSSCTECHLSGVELKEYILEDQAKSFAALRERGLIDVRDPDKSKILEFIARRPEKPSLISEKVRQQELEAFRAWIRAAVDDPQLLQATADDDAVGAKLPAEVIRHARKDRVLASFIDNVWSEVGRCAACHAPGRNQQQVKKFGEQVSWIKLRDPQATLNYMLEASLIDVEFPEDSLLLTKPALLVEHGGGQKIAVGDRTYKQFRQFVEDYAATVKGRYTSAEQLPPPGAEVSAVSEIWLKLTDVPAQYDKKLLRVDAYKREGDGWSQMRWATADRLVAGNRRLWQQHLTLIAARQSPRADELRRAQSLPAGEYLLKVFVDQQGKLEQDYAAEFGDEEFVGQTTVTTKWPPGYGRMTTVKFPSR